MNDLSQIEPARLNHLLLLEKLENTTYININDLPELKDVIEDVESEQDVITDEDIENLLESINNIIDDYYQKHIPELKRYDYDKVLVYYVNSMVNELYELEIMNYDLDVDDLIDLSFKIYYSQNNNCRSYDTSFILNNQNEETKQRIDNLLENYKNREQPEQRTDAWYQFRWNLLTASSIWKALDTGSNKNNLILGKCEPINPEKYSSTNINSPFHNGHKYEPLSVMIYENRFDTKVDDFGCMAHKTHKFIGASPDGINTKRDNERYGRMLEIKNPVSRKLSGTPKKDYWIQMQIQMEVWDLNECDFYETCFKEYANEEEFLKDGDDFKYTEKNQLKGVMVMFSGKDEPEYMYSPIKASKEEFDEWYDKTMEEKSNSTWIKNIYWYLEDESLVLVPRNKEWFATALPKFKTVWDTILKERETGYEHRKPKRKNKRKGKAKINATDFESASLFEEMYDEEYDEVFEKEKKKKDKVNSKVVIKVRTESFAE